MNFLSPRSRILSLLILILVALLWLFPGERQYAFDYVKAVVVPHASAARTPDGVVESVIVVGDGGELNRAAGELVFAQATLSAQPTTVVYMGDNVYPSGVLRDDDPQAQVSRERLARQYQKFKGTSVKLIFVPGNHDWDRSGPDGWNAIRRQQEILEREVGPGSLAPQDGCPGPTEAYKSSYLRIVAIDTEWLLRKYLKPHGPESGCTAWTSAQLSEQLGKMLAASQDGVPTILVQHHPLLSHGEHSRANHSEQDSLSPENQEMVRIVRSGIQNAHVFLCAAGHDHHLELQHGEGQGGNAGCEYYMVSGALSYPRAVTPDKETLFSYPKFGIMRLDFLSDGGVNLRAIATHLTDKYGILLYEQKIREGAKAP